MIRGRVIGTLWGAQHVPALAGRKLALVAQLDGAEPTGRVIVAIDLLHAEVGREVVVSFGSGARTAVDARGGRATLADAAITQIIEGSSGCS